MSADWPYGFFRPHELACQCGRCGLDGTQALPALMERLEALREIVGSPIGVSSGLRCRAHNRAEKGRPGSAHLYGLAADLRTGGDGQKLFRMIGAALDVGFTGIGVYRGWLHVDAMPAGPLGPALDGTRPPKRIVVARPAAWSGR